MLTLCIQQGRIKKISVESRRRHTRQKRWRWKKNIHITIKIFNTVIIFNFWGKMLSCASEILSVRRKSTCARFPARCAVASTCISPVLCLLTPGSIYAEDLPSTISLPTLVSTGWIKIKYSTGKYAISLQPVV